MQDICPTSGGNGGDSLDHLPGEAELIEDLHNPRTETRFIKHLLHELKVLYEQRLSCLELDATATREELLQVS